MDQQIKILIVDDDHLIRRWLRLFINQSHEGIEKIVFEAEDGLQAIEVLREHSFDLVISDLKMPHMDGLELVKFVQQNHPHIFTIVLSAYNELDDVKNALKFGAKDYILKAEMQIEDISKMITQTLEFKNKWLKDQAKLDFVKHDMALWQYFLMQSEANFLQADAFDVLYEEFPKQIFALFFSLRPNELSEGLPLITNTALTLAVQAKLAEREVNSIILPLENDSFLVIYSFDNTQGFKNDFIDRMMLSFQDTTDDIFATHDLEVGAYSVETFPNLTELKNSFYRSYRKFLHIRYYASYEEDMYQDKLSQFARQYFQDSKVYDLNGKHLSNQLQIALTNKDFQFILATLPQALDTLHQDGTDPESIMNFVYRLTSEINMVEFSDELIEEAEVISHRLLRSESSASMLSLLWKWYEMISQNQNQLKQLSLPIIKAKAYIDEHYGERITLESVSKVVYLSSSYLSHLFYKESGIYFTDYLELVRIQRACDLLKNEDMLIRDISLSVGFSSQAYFSRSFKKIMKVSPAEYRRSHLMKF